MKAFNVTLVFLAILALSACNAQTLKDQEEVAVNDQELQVYYFHFSKRCATCNAVEAETKIALENYYAEQVKEGHIAFTSLNLEEEDGKKMAEQLKVSGQTLLLVKGKQQVNLTNEGFMNARTQPEKFHSVLKNQIDKLL